MAHLVNYTTDRGVALLVLNDPPVNTYTHEMINDLDQCITDARFDDDVHVILITGHGEHSFCAGANLSMLRETDPHFRRTFFQHAAEVIGRLESTPKLIIAGINGHAVGGGFALALACDLRVARRGAGTLGFREIDLGLIPGTGGITRLVRLVGKARAMQMLIESTLLDFDAAHSQGIVHEIFSATSGADFLDQLRAYSHRFTPPNKPPRAIGALKRAVHAAAHTTLEQDLALEREILWPLLGSEDLQEGLLAWVDKRKAEFQGR